MSVKAHHPEYDEFIQQWKRCEDAAEGQDEIHKAGVKYLPMLKNQTNDDYQAYKLRATFFNATWRTISGLSGMLFRKPPKIDVPAVTEPLLDTITEDGQPIGIFAREVVEECLTVGRVGIMVDFPTVPVNGITQADAQLMNLRPTMSLYEAESIINWREQVINNRRVLTMVVLVEETAMPVDEFESKEEERYRVLDLLGDPVTGKVAYRQRLFRVDPVTQQDQQIGEDLFPMMRNARMEFIPFYFLSADDTQVCPDEPPLIDLVDLNLSHYRSVADYEHGCHFTGLPTGYISGHTLVEGEKIYLGSQTMLVFPNPDTRVGFLEFSGAGLAALKDNISRKEEQMAVLGARMLEKQMRGVESAETAGIHRAGENSMLASVAQAISLGMQMALQTFSDWAGGNGEVSFELNRDFFPMPMDPASLTAMVSAWQTGAISKETLFENLQMGQIIADSRTFEDEETKINNQMILTPGSDPLATPPETPPN
jgi:hypothetical protein